MDCCRRAETSHDLLPIDVIWQGSTHMIDSRRVATLLAFRPSVKVDKSSRTTDAVGVTSGDHVDV
jgi:hypothetical protein